MNVDRQSITWEQIQLSTYVERLCSFPTNSTAILIAADLLVKRYIDIGILSDSECELREKFIRFFYERDKDGLPYRLYLSFHKGIPKGTFSMFAKPYPSYSYMPRDPISRLEDVLAGKGHFWELGRFAVRDSPGQVVLSLIASAYVNSQEQGLDGYFICTDIRDAKKYERLFNFRILDETYQPSIPGWNGREAVFSVSYINEFERSPGFLRYIMRLLAPIN